MMHCDVRSIYVLKTMECNNLFDITEIQNTLQFLIKIMIIIMSGDYTKNTIGLCYHAATNL